jgi:hypothetical protein
MSQTSRQKRKLFALKEGGRPAAGSLGDLGARVVSQPDTIKALRRGVFLSDRAL